MIPGIDWVEAFGFATGAICVWLTVRQNVWNWPAGIANNVFFVALFWRTRLYADMALQFVYIALAAAGWYWWLRGGENRGELRVSRIGRTTALICLAVTLAATAGMDAYLRRVNDSAPLADAFTTAGSLAAQYLLTRKILESWYVWIAVDVVYVVLYVVKGLHLTAVLYALFIVMCAKGLTEWRKSAAKAS